MAYPKLIPKYEEWIDSEMAPKEWPHIAAHESIEAFCMEFLGLPYPVAHQIATSGEYMALDFWKGTSHA